MCFISSVTRMKNHKGESMPFQLNTQLYRKPAEIPARVHSTQYHPHTITFFNAFECHLFLLGFFINVIIYYFYVMDTDAGINKFRRDELQNSIGVVLFLVTYQEFRFKLFSTKECHVFILLFFNFSSYARLMVLYAVNLAFLRSWFP